MKSSDYMQQRFASTIKDARLFFSSCLSMHMVPVIFALVFIVITNRNSESNQVAVQSANGKTIVGEEVTSIVRQGKSNAFNTPSTSDTEVSPVSVNVAPNQILANRIRVSADKSVSDIFAVEVARVVALQTTLSVLKVLSGSR